ncbi:hypothetical protein L209DRAFT_758741 [Thermothelomyces heterothallicus CBS 203.75]
MRRCSGAGAALSPPLPSHLFLLHCRFRTASPAERAAGQPGKQARRRRRRRRRRGETLSRRDSAALMTVNVYISSFQSEQRVRERQGGSGFAWNGSGVERVGRSRWGEVAGESGRGSNMGVILYPWLSSVGTKRQTETRTRACPVMTEGPKSQICRQQTGSGLPTAVGLPVGLSVGT